MRLTVPLVHWDISDESVRERITCDPPEIVRMGNNEVHVWKSCLDVDEETTRRFFGLLSEDEKQKALRFHAARHRRKYIVAHGLLRVIVGGYVEADPRSLTFRMNQYGKPFLCPDQKTIPLFFNLSHSHNLCMIAVCSGQEIGIDVEYMNRDINVREIAKRFFSKNENEKINSLPEGLGRHAFFRCWTRKEAYLKAKGKGLFMDLHRFEVSVLPTEPAVLLGSDESPEDIDRWHLCDLDPYPEYAGALSVGSVQAT
jgi:4'-phosphopantetheinyl transferase